MTRKISPISFWSEFFRHFEATQILISIFFSPAEIRRPTRRTSSIKTTEKSFQYGRRANESIWVQRNMWRSFAMFCVWRKMFVCVGISIGWTNTRLLRAITSITSTYGPSMCSIPATIIHSMWCPYSCCNWLASLTWCRNGRNCICAYFCVSRTKRIVTGTVQANFKFDSRALITTFDAAILVWIRQDTKNRPNINCGNCWRSFEYRPKSTKFPNGHATKSLRATVRCCRNSPKIEATTMHQSPKRMSTDPNCTCKSNETNTFFQSKNFRNKILTFFSFSAIRANQVIQERSNQTAVTFIYLASPPLIDSATWPETSVTYLDLLTELTADLPPTILVHGTHSVTSTTL